MFAHARAAWSADPADVLRPSSAGQDTVAGRRSSIGRLLAEGPVVICVPRVKRHASDLGQTRAGSSWRWSTACSDLGLHGTSGQGYDLDDIAPASTSTSTSTSFVAPSEDIEGQAAIQMDQGTGLSAAVLEPHGTQGPIGMQQQRRGTGRAGHAIDIVRDQIGGKRTSGSPKFRRITTSIVRTGSTGSAKASLQDG